jgi:hypothetical protein
MIQSSNPTGFTKWWEKDSRLRQEPATDLRGNLSFVYMNALVTSIQRVQVGAAARSRSTILIVRTVQGFAQDLSSSN